MTSKAFTERIRQLDPVTDHQEMVFLLACHIFPWDVGRAMELALFRAFALPSVSRQLDATGEFVRRPRKRYDDTELLLYELLENGYDSERARRVFRRLKIILSRFSFSNEDILYLLSTFIFEPIRWIDRYGWRPLTVREQLAVFYFFCEVGRRAGIANIPDSFIVFEDFNEQYELENFRYEEANRRLAEPTMDQLLSFHIPDGFFGLGRWVLSCFMDPHLVSSLGLPQPPVLLRNVVSAVMTIRAQVATYLPEPSQPVLQTHRIRPTYPEGYEIEELGVVPAKE